MTHEEIRTLIHDADNHAAIEAIAKCGDALPAAKLFLSMATDLYWKSKDLPATISIASAGITFGLTQSLQQTDAAIANELRGTAKAIAYNLGSFCWPGWGEPGITIGATECAIGHDAARCNLRLAIELKRPAKGMGNAYWLVGAYELALREFDAAIKSFDQARTTFGDDRAMALMAAGYRELARHLQSQDSTTAQQSLDDAINALLKEDSDDGKAFADQIPAAEQALRGWFAKRP